MSVKKVFAERLKLLREEKELTQGELGDILGVSRGTISFYESAKRTADIDFLIKASNYFDVDIDYLLGVSSVKNGKTQAQEILNNINLSEENIKLLTNIFDEIEDMVLSDADFKEYIVILNDFFNMILKKNIILNIFASKKILEDPYMSTICKKVFNDIDNTFFEQNSYFYHFASHIISAQLLIDCKDKLTKIIDLYMENDNNGDSTEKG